MTNQQEEVVSIEKLLQLKINFPRNYTSNYLKVYCDTIFNSKESNLLKRFKHNDSFFNNFNNLDFYPLNKTRINSIEFLFKNENNDAVLFDIGEIVLELRLKEF